MAIELSKGVWLAGRRAGKCLYCSHGTFYTKCIRCEVRQQTIEQKKLRMRKGGRSGVLRLKGEAT